MTKTWTYDALQRLTGEAVISSISGQSYTDTYSYDLVGNRLSKTDVVGSTTTVATDSYNNDDQLSSESGTVNGSSSWQTTYQYDLNGSLTNVTRTGSGSETDTYGYDLQHRLSSATINRSEQGQSVAISASYAYDDSGYRASGTVTTTIGSGSPTTTTTQYLTDTNNPTGYTQVLEEHTNGTTAPSMSYILGLSVVGQTAPSGGTSILMPDGQGSTRMVTDLSANIVVRYRFDAYGNLLGVSVGVTSPPTTKILYTGEQFDPVLLQYYLRSRYYYPGTGRFLNRDTVYGNLYVPVSMHTYLYGNADPVDNQDPTGRGVFDFIWTAAFQGLIRKVSPYVALAILIGISAHSRLMRAYRDEMGNLGVKTNSPIFSFFGFSSIGGRAGSLRPDIVNLNNGEVYEIKPGLGDLEQVIEMGVTQLAKYLSVLLGWGGGGGAIARPNFKPGTRWTPQPIYWLSPFDYPYLPLGLHIFAWRPVPGVILYIPGPEAVFYAMAIHWFVGAVRVRQATAARLSAGWATAFLLAIL